MVNSTSDISKIDSCLGISSIGDLTYLVEGGHIDKGRVHGWVTQPNMRGTLDLLWGPIFTVFLCSWTVLCLHVPAKQETRAQVLLRRVRWMIIAISGPEFVLTIAAGQWASALRSVQAFKEIGFPHWTSRHAYFADMGGIHLSTADMDPFPINAKQLHYLVSKGYVSYPAIERKEISDKSKANTFAKTITILQSSWLILQCLGRWAQNLAITPLELSAVAIVVCSLATYVCWLHKPADVDVPLVLRTEYSVKDILVGAGDAAKLPYWQTPLDFIDNQGPSWSANVMTFARIPSQDPGRPRGSGPLQRPLPRFTNDRLPDLHGLQKALLFFVTLVYSGIHVAGWNFTFPTRVEQVLWRVCSLVLLLSTFFYWVFETLAVFTRTYVWGKAYYRIFYGEAKILEFEEKLAAQPPKRQASDVPLRWEFLLLFVLWIIYVLSRFYLIVEVFVGLRSVPCSVFRSIQWSNFIPHM